MTSSSPAISVIMPVKNAAKYLKQAIDSILMQTFKDFEFLIIYDHSIDNTKDIIVSFQDPRIKLIELEESVNNISKSLNLGISMASGRYIVRMDADDISLPDRLQVQYDFMESNPDISIMGTNIILIDAKNNINKCKHSFYLSERPKIIDILFECPLVHPTVMFRKEDLEKYDLKYNEDFFGVEDQELWSRALKVVNIANIKQPLLKYRFHNQNASKLLEQQSEEKLNLVKINILKWLYSTGRSNLLLDAARNIKTKEIHSINLPFNLPFIKAYYKDHLSTATYKLFGIIPIIKVCKKNKSQTYKLFNFIPLIQINTFNKVKVFRLLKLITLFKVE